jgi:hypothetical protein
VNSVLQIAVRLHASLFIVAQPEIEVDNHGWQSRLAITVGKDGGFTKVLNPWLLKVVTANIEPSISDAALGESIGVQQSGLRGEL